MVPLRLLHNLACSFAQVLKSIRLLRQAQFANAQLPWQFKGLTQLDIGCLSFLVLTMNVLVCRLTGRASKSSALGESVLKADIVGRRYISLMLRC